MASPLSESLLNFIHECVPTYQAAEVMLFLSAHPGRDWTPRELATAMRPAVITPQAVAEYLARFVASGLVVRRSVEGERFAYAPVSAQIEAHIEALAHAYNERPVTLVAAIYGLTEDRIGPTTDTSD